MYDHRFTCKLQYINILRLSTFCLSPFPLNIDILLFEWIPSIIDMHLNKGNNKITELRAILQRESQNS